MSDYNSFIFSISKYPLIKLEEIITEDKIRLRLNEAGSNLGRTIQICTNLLTLTNDILDKLPLTANSPQEQIGYDFAKINLLNPFLLENISKHDQSFPDNHCSPHFSSLVKILKDIEPYIYQLASNTASSTAQRLDSLNGNLTSVIELYNTIISTAKKCENQLQSTITDISADELQISYRIAASLTAFDELLIQLKILSSNSAIQNSDDLKNLNYWIEKGTKLWEKLFGVPRTDEHEVSVVINEIAAELGILSSIISKIQTIISDSIDFVNSSISLTNLIQILNEIESKITSKRLNEIIENLPTFFLSGQPLDSLVITAKDLLDEIQMTEDPSFMASYSTLTTFIHKNDNDLESTAICLISIVRLVARYFNDAHLGEEVLSSLTKSLATIAKSVFIESRKTILQINKVIDLNLEFFNDFALNEANYFLTAAKNVDNFDIESDQFVSNQQIFFESLCALPTPLKKLVSACSSVDAKNQLQEFLEIVQDVGDQFSRWLNQFYLTLFSIIHLRAEMIVDSLSFPIKLYCSSGQEEQVKGIQDIFLRIQKIIKSTPQVITGDIKDVLALMDLIVELSKFGDDLISLVKANAQSPLFPLYKQSADALSEIIIDIPSYIQALQHTIEFETQEVFICSMLAFINCSQRLANSKKFEDDDASNYQLLSPSFTYVLFANSFVDKNSSQNGETLKPLMKYLHTKMSDVLSFVVHFSLDEQTTEKVNFSEELQNFIKAMNDLLSSISILKQPSLQYNIPDDVHEIRKFDSIASSLHSKKLKEFAQYIVSVMKKKKAPDVRSVLSKWFDATQISTVSLTKSFIKFKESISNLLKDLTQNDRSGFIDSFASFSVSLASNEDSYDKSVSDNVVLLHQNLVFQVIELLESKTNDEYQLKNIYRCITEISSMLPISLLKEKERDGYLSNILKKIIMSLHNLRQKEPNQTQLDDELEIIEYVEELSVFFQVYVPEDDFGVDELIDKTFEWDDGIEKEVLDEFISKFSEKLIQLVPTQFSMLSQIEDNDSVCDFIYDKAEAFRDNVNIILQFAKNHEGSDERINSSLKVMLLSASDAAVLINHSLSLGHLESTALSPTFVSCFSELQISLRQFADSSLMILKKPSENMQPELRKVNRKMVKQFDTFINIVEDPQQLLHQQRQQTILGSREFEQMKNEMFSVLAIYLIQIARLNALSVTSLVPEMYSQMRADVANKINECLEGFYTKVSTVLSKAVGPSSTEFVEISMQLEAETKVLLSASEKLTFDLTSFTSLPLLVPSEKICVLTEKMTSLGPQLADQVIIKPDPEAASRVPEDYVLPSPPKSAPQVEEAYEALLNVRKAVSEKVTIFKETNENEVASSNELLSTLIDLRGVSNEFVEKALIMAVATVNPLYQVEQQTGLHAFANALNGVQNSLKNRLMRTKSFKSEMSDALSLFNSTIEKSMEFAETASKVEDQPAQEEDVNEVTRELNTAAAVVELMSARLKEFENQVNLDVIQNEENEDIFNEKAAKEIGDLQAAIDSLPAYLIAASNSIFESTTQIIKRAKQITSELLKKFGKIENEKGMIKSAQELSEAAELLLVCAEILVQGEDKSAEYKALTAAKIINAAVVSLRVQVLQKGGDQEGVITKFASNVKKYSDCVIYKSEAIIQKKLQIEYDKKPKRGTIQIQTINQNEVVKNLRNNLAKEEQNLKAFRSPQKKKK